MSDLMSERLNISVELHLMVKRQVHKLKRPQKKEVDIVLRSGH